MNDSSSVRMQQGEDERDQGEEGEERLHRSMDLFTGCPGLLADRA